MRSGDRIIGLVIVGVVVVDGGDGVRCGGEGDRLFGDNIDRSGVNVYGSDRVLQLLLLLGCIGSARSAFTVVVAGPSVVAVVAVAVQGVVEGGTRTVLPLNPV